MGSAKWWGVSDWYIDPAQTHGGSDENDGLTSSTPIKSIAEWRRRIRGAVFTGTGPVIHAMSGSTATDDGMFYGFSTPDLSTYVRLVLTPTPTGLSGTVGSYVAYSGNTRGQFTDSAIPVSWTASAGISVASGSRFVRKIAASGVRHYAPLLADLGTKSVQMGIVVDWDETDATTIRTTETNFSNTDAYEVVSMPTWPCLNVTNCNVLMQCADVQGLVSPLNRSASNNGGQIRYRLCGFPQNISMLQSAILYSCVMSMTGGDGLAGTGINSPLLFNCAATNGANFQIGGAANEHFTNNVFVNSTYTILHGACGASLGGLRVFDCAANFIRVGYTSSAVAVAPIIGSGNLSTLVQCDTGGLFYGAANITATTSASNKFSIGGVGHNSPAVETTGDAIYA